MNKDINIIHDNVVSLLMGIGLHSLIVSIILGYLVWLSGLMFIVVAGIMMAISKIRSL